MPRCVCGHSDEMHFAGVKEGHKLTDFACCRGDCPCDGWLWEGSRETPLPCPFCGCEHVFAARGDEMEWLYCVQCGACGPEARWERGPRAVSYPWATAGWNRRPAPSAQTQEEQDG